MLMLIVTAGPEKGRTYELPENRSAVLGREGDPIAVDDRKASRRHARLWCEDGRWFVQDLGSRHGTYCNRELVDGPTEVQDGDSIRFGKSVFVLARRSTEQAERLALASAPAEIASAPDRSGFFSTRGGKLAGAGLAAAAGLALAANAGLYLTTTEQAHRIQQTIARLPQADDDAQLAKRVDQVIARLDGQHDRDKAIRDILAAVSDPDTSLPPELRKKLDTVLARLDDQPDVAGKLDAMAKSNHQQLASLRQALADQATASREAGQSLAAVTDGIDRMLVTLRSEDAAAKAARSLTAAVRDQLAQAAPAIQELSRKLEARTAAGDQNTDKVLAAIGEVKTAIPAQTTALTELAQANRTLMKTMVTELENRRAQHEVLAAIRQVQESVTGDTSNKKLTQMLARLNDRPTGDATTRQQLAKAVNQAIAPLADVVAGASSEPNQKLDRVLAALHEREQTDRKLASLYDTLKQQPEQTRAMLDQALASLKQDPGQDRQTQTALTRVLAEIRGKMITDTDRIGVMVHRQVAQALDSRRKALPGSRPGDAAGPTDTAVADADDGAESAGATDGSSGATVSASLARADRVAADAADPAELTPREQAYKLAFETGQPVTIGGGLLNPVTGEVSQGRLLDPADAKAQGIDHWRDWYLMDDIAERMRLQNLAQSYRTRRGNGSAVVAIPDGDQAEDSKNAGGGR